MKTVARALEILELIISQNRLLGVTEISNKLGINKSTAHKVLTVLNRYGYVEKRDQKYNIGYKYINVCGKMLGSMSIRTIAYPYMKELSLATGETVNLMILLGMKGIYVEQIESTKSAKLTNSIGDADYLHATALGKSLLAFLPEQTVKEIIKREGLKQLSDKTINSEEKLKEELEIVRSRGFSIDDEESCVGARCVAAPIFNHNNEVIAAISVSGLTFDVSLEKLYDYSILVMDAAKKITQKL